MATKRMLVDAIHPEETRIVVTNGNRLEEFDFESATRRQLRGNIYLAKVTRVEPSLQAAFIDYGGNRHGFLAFSEIHPDYYQIPVADREALLREEQEAEEAHERETERKPRRGRGKPRPAAEGDEGETAEASETVAADDGAAIDSIEERADAPTEAGAEDDPQSTEPPAGSDEDQDDDHEDGDEPSNVEQAPRNTEPVESIGGGDALEDMQERRRPSVSRRNYKIQEVIKRRQVMLVQVVKEERGNKGAALTTYLSLAGRYSVLMPNTARGGGISRKITNAADRKRLKDIVGDLDIPPGQGIILRTAGASRTKAEVKRDFEYLQRLWENVRTLTLKSTAPCLVYEEGSLIKRTIRDLYSKEIDELLVSGEEAHREAKEFMRMIMPSHAKNVQVYKEDQPIFSRYNVENQLDQMFSPQVTLPSGGYIVINPTEALVSIDVNSGRATKEHNIEDTALQTNLEAAEEISRQLRLRDLAGLIVIDFIDMIENRSNRAVERKLKECLKNDRARIQVGRISHFGLMEMSRQRIRFGVVESSTHKCPTCAGTGLVRSVESLALMVMRQVEDHVLRKPGISINVRVPTDVALYILNTKRGTLSGLENKHNLSITIVADDHVGPSHYAIERGEQRVAEYREQRTDTHISVDTAALPVADEPEPVDDEEAEGEGEGEETSERSTRSDDGDRGGRGRRRRRGRGRGDRGEERENRPQHQPRAVVAADGSDEDADDSEDAEGDEQPERQQGNGEQRLDDNGEPRRRRRRGRRGGRRNRRPDENGERIGANADPAPVSAAAPDEEAPSTSVAAESPEQLHGRAVGDEEPVAEPAEKPKRARRTRKSADADAAVQDAPSGAAADEAATDTEAAAKPRRGRGRGRKAAGDAVPASDAPAEVAVETAPSAPEPAAAEPEPPRRPKKELPPDEIVVSSTAPSEEQPKKKGWWNRGFFG
jgi:ribonuclease E